MAGSTDTRVVQLQFENRQFERNIAKSKKSLDDLKESMNFDETSKGLDKFSEGLNGLRFNKLEENIQKLTDKFTGLGTVSELIISQIRRKIEEAARSISNFADSMTTQQIAAGQEKYNMLNKSVRTIMNATGKSEEEVYSVMERLNKYTDQTSYDFADMANNIGKFTSVGIPLEKAEKQMEGIANWAAQSGAGINEASRAMYNLSQAMGMGKLTKIDWKSIENAGMATKQFKEQMIEAGIAAGTLKRKGDKVFTAKGNVKVDYTNFADTLAKGWATKEVLGNTLENYYWDDLYYESEEAFKKALANDQKITKEEWKIFEEKKYVNEESKKAALEAAAEQGKLVKETKKNGEVIYKFVDQNGKKIEINTKNFTESLSYGWFDSKVYESAEENIGGLAKTSFEAAQKCLTFVDVLQAWKDQISTGWMNSFRLIFGDLSESMEFFSGVCDKVSDSISGLIEFRNKILGSWAEQGGRTSLFESILGNYTDDAESSAYGLIDMIQGVGKLIKDAFWDLMGIFIPENMKELWNDDMFVETGGREAFFGSFLKNITDNIQNAMRSIRDFFNEEIQVGDGTKSRMQLIRETIMVFASAIRIAYDIISGFIGFIGNIADQLRPTFDAILEFLGTLGLTLYNATDEARNAHPIQEFFKSLAETLRPVTNAINTVVKAITDMLNSLLRSGKASDKAKSFFGNIGDVIKKVADFAAKLLAPTITFIGDLILILKDLFSGGFGEENLKKSGEKFKEALNKMLGGMPESIQKIIDFFKTLYNNIKNVIKNRFSPDSMKKMGADVKTAFSGVLDKAPEGLKEGGKSVLEKIKEFFVNLWNKITGFFKGDGVGAGGDATPKETVFDRVKNWLIDGYNNIKTGLQQLVGNMGGDAASFGTWIKNTFKDVNLSKILLIIIGALGVVGIVKAVMSVIKTVKGITEAVKNLTTVLDGGFFKKLLNPEEDKVESFGDKMLKIAAAIGLIAAAVILIGNMKWEDALKGIGIVALIAGVLIGSAFAMKEAFKDMDPKQAFALLLGMYGIALAIAKIVSALLPVANVSDVGLFNMISVLAVVFLGLLGIIKMAENGGGSKENLLGLAGATAAIALLIVALKRVANLEPDQLLKMMGVLTAILAELIGFVWAIHKTSLSGKELGQLAALAGAIAILIIALKRVANMKPEQLVKMMVVLGVILGMIIGFVWAIHKTSVDGKGLGQIAALAGAIALIMFALVPLSILPFGKLMGAVLAVGIILAALVVATKVIGEGATTLAGSGLAQLLALAGAVVLIALALIPLAIIAHFDFGALMGAVLAVVSIIVILGLIVIAASEYPAKPSSMVGLLAVAGAVVILVLALTPLALMEWDGLLKMGAALIVIMGSLAIVMAAASKIKASAVATMTLLVGMLAIVILAMGAAMHDVKDIDWKVILSFTGGLAAMLILMAAAAAIASVIGIKGFAILAIGLVLIMGAIALMAPLLIGSVMSALKNAAADLHMIGELMKMFSSTMGDVDESGFDKAKRLFTKMMDILTVVAGVVFTSDDTKEFMLAMSKLTLATDEIIDFDTKIKGMSADGGVTKAKYIVGLFKDLLQNDLAGFGQYVASTDSFYTAIFNLGSAFDYFDSMTSDIGSADENQGLQLIKQLAACAPDLDTIYKMDLDRLKTQLAELGGAMIIYAQGAAKVNGGEITEDTDVGGAITLLKKISESFASEGGFAIPDNMPTDKELTDFGVQLAALAGALVAFEEAGTKLGDGTKNGIKALDYFYELKTKLSESTKGFGTDLSTAIDSFKGENGQMIQPSELEKFGEDIAKLGSAMAHFASSTQIIDEETHEAKPIDFTKATDALQAIADLQSKLPNLDGVMDVIAGKPQTLTDLAPEINLLGDALNKFYKNTTTFDDANKVAKPMDFKNTIDMLNSLGDLSTQLNQIKIRGFNIESLFIAQGMSLSDLGTQLSQLGIGMGTFGEKIAGKFSNVDDINNALLALNGLVTLLTNLSVMASTSYLDPADYALGLNKFLTQLVNGITTVDEDGTEVTKWYDSLSLLVEVMQWISAELDKFPEIKIDNLEKFNLLAQALGHLTAIDLKKNQDFEFVGLQIAEGFASGMKKGESIVTEAAEELAMVAYNAAIFKLGVKSPSREFMEIGNYVSLGMAKGITNESDAVAKSSESMAQSAVSASENVFGIFNRLLSGSDTKEIEDSFSRVLSIVNDIMTSELDPNPTITPVLDMSEATRNLQAFKKDFGMGYSVSAAMSSSIAGRASGPRSESTETTLKVDLNDIYTRMDAMNNEFTQLGEKIAQMKLVLDTGVLAGGVTTGVNEGLGRIELYEGRRN